MPISEIDWNWRAAWERDIHVVSGAPSRSLAGILLFKRPPTANGCLATGKSFLKAGDATGDSNPSTVTLPAAIGGAVATANMLFADAWDPAHTKVLFIQLAKGCHDQQTNR